MSSFISLITTENKILCNMLTFPLILIEVMSILFFAITIYNLSLSLKQKTLFVSIFSLCATTFRLSIPLPYNTIISFILFVILCIYILKISVFKGFIVQAISLLITVLSEYIITIIATKFLKLNIYTTVNIPIFKLILCSLIYSVLIFVTLIIKLFKLNLNVSDEMSKKKKLNVLLSVLLILFMVCPNLIFLILIDMKTETYYIIYNLICSFILFLIGTYNTYQFNKSDITERELITANLYNNTLTKLVDANRGFKHDINNIIQAIGGYLELNDIEGLKVYYKTGLLKEIDNVNNLSAINPNAINSPPLFGLIVNKYNYAENKGVEVKLSSFFDYSTINMNIFDFVKIFGILFDNAIEAASLCEKKVVELYVNIDFYNRKQIFKISNTYSNKDLDEKKIFEKNYSTKEKKSGFGLWEVSQLLKQHPNTKLTSIKEEHFFTQKLEILF